MITQAEVTTRKTFQGAWECSAVVDGQHEHFQYFGYTKREAIREFVAMVKDKQKQPKKAAR